MNPLSIAQMVAVILGQVAPATKTPIDDAAAKGVSALLALLGPGSAKDKTFYGILASLEILKPILEKTAATGDDKLRDEIEAAVKALERVAGSDYYRDQVPDLKVLWPDLAAPGEN